MELRFIDTHTHLADEAFGGKDGSDMAVKRALEAAVTKMIVPDTCHKERQATIDLCLRHPGALFPCVGLHPTEMDEHWQQDLEQVRTIASSPTPFPTCPESRIVAIGEAGMDLYWTKENVSLQKEVFASQIDIALECKLPIIIHAREATKEVFDVLEAYKGRGLRGVFHAFSGSIETFRQTDRYGDWSVGIGGVVTFKKASIASTVKDIPMERILLETDSPYLTPVPHRGERNESAYIPLIARFIADVRGIPVEEVAFNTTRNAETLFRI